MKNYESFDAAIVAAIKRGACRFSEIWTDQGVAREGEKLTFGSTYRLVDRRLQSLRKRGAIKCAGTKWSIA